MARKAREKNEIRELIRQYQEVYGYYQEKGWTIPKPRLTPVIAESLACHLLVDGQLGIFSCLPRGQVGFSKNGGDLVIEGEGSNTTTIEVKSTGEREFQYFSERDLAADFIIWVNFGKVLRDKECKSIEVYLITRREGTPVGPMKISLGEVGKYFDEESEKDFKVFNYLSA